MALSGVTHAGVDTPGIASGEALFERLPERLFAPLASPNRHRYWKLLCRLYERRFGPDAPLPPSVGFPTREITRDIEEELQAQDEWELEGGEPLETPVGIRAIEVFNRLRDSGWIRVDRHGVRDMVSMAPAVAQFMSRLVEFAETGPVFVAGKVRSIEANLQLIVKQNADGDTLQEAASQTRNLLEHVRNTGTNIRDLMASFSVEMTTAHYVQRFFSDYIERVFIGDYRELRSAREHPLSRKQQILDTIESIHVDPTHRERLIRWYGEKRAGGDMRRAELMFERDMERLREIRRIHEYLERLDEEIRRANKRALAFLDYRLKSLRPIDRLVEHAIAAVSNTRGTCDEAPFAPGELIGASRLALPRREFVRPPSIGLRIQAVSAEEEARSRLMLRARDTRSVTPPQLAEFVRNALEGRSDIQSNDLDIETIVDVRVLQILTALSMAFGSDSRSLRLQAMNMARGFLVTQDGERELPGTWLSHIPFRVALRRRLGERASR